MSCDVGKVTERLENEPQINFSRLQVLGAVVPQRSQFSSVELCYEVLYSPYNMFMNYVRLDGDREKLNYSGKTTKEEESISFAIYGITCMLILTDR